MNSTKPVTIQATYRIVTPMFCGGAEQQAEFRLASFKGVLRFWWRAVEWGRIQDLAQLHREEAALFGSSDGGQARFLMRVNKPISIGAFEGSFPPALIYLAGMGLCKPNGQFLRKPLNPGGSLSVMLRVKCGDRCDADLRQLRGALIALGLFGGIGARSRRGFGSLTLHSIQGPIPDWKPPRTVVDLRTQIAELLASSQNNTSLESPFSAFSRGSRVVLVEGQREDSAQGLLEKIGREFVRYRSYGVKAKDGRRRNVLGEEVTLPNFPDDHNSIYSFLSDGAPVVRPPMRAAFGLPHNYFFKSLSDPPARNVKAEVTPSEHDRRASPLFIHIHAAPDGQPTAVCIFLPGQFLPRGERIRIADQSSGKSLGRQRFSPSTVSITETDARRPIDDFLNRLVRRNDLKESFGPIGEVEVAHG